MGEPGALGTLAVSPDGRLRRRMTMWFGGRSIYLVLAALAYIPPLLVRRGVVSADNKVYLYLDPSRMLADAPYLWDPNTFAGTVPHQGVGYLFPVAPYYWLIDKLGIPVWIGQRIWLSTVLFFAGAGVVYLLRVLRWHGPGVVVAALAYMFTPYFLNYASAFTVIALPWTGLPWLLAFVMLAVRDRGWRYPALYAITIQLTGSVNASSLAFSIFASLLWLPFAVWLSRELTFREALRVLGRLGSLTFVASLWWMSGLWAQSRYGINVLEYSETARTVAQASSPSEVLRGLGYWYFYGSDKLTPIVDSAVYYTGAIWLVALSYLVPALALFAAAFARFRERLFFVTLVVVGLVFAVGAYPWDSPPLVGSFFKWFVSSSQAGSAMRSMPRAAPLVILGLAVLLGAGVTALHEATRRQGIPRPMKWITGLDRRVFRASALLGVLILVNQPALFTGWFITKGISRPSELPSYWDEAADAINRGDSDSRVWAIPGSNFASYQWDGKLVSSVDPLLPGLTTRPFVAREQVPYGTKPTANLLIAADDPLQQNVLQPTSIAPIARFLAVGDLFVRADDLAWTRYGTVRPNQVWQKLREAPGLGEPEVFGGMQQQHASEHYPMLDEATLAMGPMPDVPRLAVVPVTDPTRIVRTASAAHPVLLDGDGSGLVDAAGAGLLSGHELVRYSASIADDPEELRSELNGAALIVTDTNRRRGQRWGTIQDTFGETETPGQEPLVDDPSNKRIDIFDNAGADDGDGARTVALQEGGVRADASSYGNPVTFTSDARAMYAVDASGGVDNENTAWTTAAFGPVNGEELRLTFPSGLTSDHVTLLQPQIGRPDRWITKVRLTLDNGFSTTLDLGKESRKSPGQTFSFPGQTFHSAVIRIIGDNVGHQYIYETASSVGFANVTFGPQTPRLTEYIRLPEDLLTSAGRGSLKNPLALVLTRDRISPFNALRVDPEPSMIRAWTLPVARSFAMTGIAHLDPRSAASVVDRTLGIPDADDGGVTVTEKRHLTGAPEQRATSAIDGAADTGWTTGFASSVGNWAQYVTARSVSFDHLDLRVVADQRHSIPTKLKVTVDGESVTVPVPAITASSKIGNVVKVRVNLPRRLSGSKIRFTIAGQREKLTNDWYSDHPIPMPVSIAEWGVSGLHVDVPTPDASLPSGCNPDLALLDNKSVGLHVAGTVGEALSGADLRVTTCGSSTKSGIHLDADRHNLLLAPGASSGYDIDQLVLRSAAGGDADGRTGTMVSRAETTGPKVVVDHQGRTSFDLTVTGADDDFWLVLAQSQSDGWKATVDGKDIGSSELVNGYANGWKVEPSRSGTLHVTLTWIPQRVVWIAIGISAVAMLLCLVLALRPGLRRRLAPLADDAAPNRANRAGDSVPLPFHWRTATRYPGAQPKLKVAIPVTVAAAIGAGAAVGWWAAPIVGGVAIVCLRARRARPLLTFGAPACMLVVMAYTTAFVLLRDTYLRFGWPSWFTRVAPLGWFAVIALALDVVVERCWLRRWWASGDADDSSGV